jgi:DNA phosphorothioation-associated putative methyltransferase
VIHAEEVPRLSLDAPPSKTFEPLLRVFEGCGRACLGEFEGANIVKIHRRSGKLSYLVYPDFDDDPQPALLRSIRVNLRTRQIDNNDYAQSSNPPVLHRKETFLAADHPLRDKSPGSRPKKRSTAYWRTGAGSARGRDG